MFEKIVLRRREDAELVTPGQIAEAMLFYQSVHLIVDRGTFGRLLQSLGIGAFLSLLQRPGFTATYCEEDMIARTHKHGAFTTYTLDTMMFIGHQDVGTLPNAAARLAYLIEQAGSSKRESRKLADKVLQRVPIRRLSGNTFVDGGVSGAAKRDLTDTNYTRDAVRAVISMLADGYVPPSDFKLDIFDTPLGFHAFNDIDFSAINTRRAAMSPSLGPITLSNVFAHIAAARADLALAAHYGGDFSTSDVASKLIELRHADMLRRARINESEIQSFVEVTLPDTPSVRDAIDAGDRTFQEFLTLLDKSDRFRQWLGEARADEGIVREYIKSMTSEPWIQRMPARSLRYVLTQAVDVLMSRPAAIATGLVDNFLVDKLLGGWRPNHFLERRLGPFLQRD